MSRVRGEAGQAQPGFLSLLKNRPDFFFLWSAKTISRMGDKITTVALAVFVLELGGGKALPVAVVLMLAHAPYFLFGWAMGVIVDRVDRRRLMIMCDIVRGALILGIPFVRAVEYTWFVSFAAATMATLYQPAISAAMPDLVHRRELLPANSLLTLSNAAIDIIGYAAASIVIMAAGVRGAFVIDFTTFMVSAVLLLMIKKSMAAPEANRRHPFLPQLKQGLNYQMGHPALRSLLIVSGLASLAFGAINALGPLVVAQLLQRPPETFGLLLSAQAVAMLVSSALIGRFLSRIMHKGQMISIGALLLGLSIMTIAVNRSLSLSLAAYFVLGLGNILFLVPAMTWVQEAAPIEFRGRVFAFRNVATNLALFLAMGSAGVLADRVGVSIVLIAAGVATMMCALTPRLLPGLWPTNLARDS